MASIFDPDRLCWGTKVSPAFRSYVQGMGERQAIDPNFLMACMAFESGRTFDPAIKNGAGSGEVGLIQFMPSTAAALGTSTAALAAMSGPQQLVFVEKYFRPNKGRLRTLSDVYMAILWPGAIGKPEEFVLFDRADAQRPKLYIQNAGLDFNRDGKITKREAADRPSRMLAMGFRPEYVWSRSA